MSRTMTRCRYAVLTVYIMTMFVSLWAFVPASASSVKFEPQLRQLIDSGQLNFGIVIVEFETGGLIPLDLDNLQSLSDRRAQISAARASYINNSPNASFLVDQSPSSGGFGIGHKFALTPQFVFTGSSQQFQQLANDSGVVAIYAPLDLYNPSSANQINGFGQNQTVNATRLWDDGFEGAGHAVAIIEPLGMTPDDFSYGNRVIAQGCFFSLITDTDCPNGTDQQTDNNALSNCQAAQNNVSCGHGTTSTRIAAAGVADPDSQFTGVARDASIIAIRAPGRIAVLRAFEHIVDLQFGGANIASINMSFGSNIHSSACTFTPYTDIVFDLNTLGIAPIAAAGNADAGNGNGTAMALRSPACVPGIISVGATTNDGNAVLRGSDFADYLDLLAPGATPENEAATSLAAPHVTGAYAILKQALLAARPNTPRDQIVEEIRIALISTGTPLPHPNGSTAVTASFIDICAAYNHLVPTNPITCQDFVAVPLNGQSLIPAH